MRRSPWAAIVVAVVAVLCLAGGAVAAERVAETSPAASLAVIVAALVAATSLGQRVVKWIRAHWAVIQVVFDVLEAFREAGDPDAANGAEQEASRIFAARIIERIGKRIADRGGETKAVADKAASRSERSVGRSGSATDTRRRTKVGRLFRGIGRWLPLVGAFL